MSLRLHNTLTRRLEEFRPLDPKSRQVGLYVCGPTVYDVPHIGHARSAFVFDVLRGYLTFKGLTVKFVRNVTDVDDKIIAKARDEQGPGDLNTKCRELTERYLQVYHDTMDRLGLARPDAEPKATDHVVPAMTDFISQLLIKGAAYEAGGPACRAPDCKAEHGAGRDVYFSVRNFATYGTLSNRSVDELHAGARIEQGEHKRDPLDFALWKAAKPEEPSWESPWGPGRPGWHIECSVMSTKELGDAFDIHGGGVDLVFPHHENEIAQAQAVGKPFAQAWIHNGLLTVQGEKMSKSLGNYVTVDDALTAYPHPDYLKLCFLKTHYRSPIDYSVERMREAKANWEEFSRFFQHSYQRQGDQTVGGGSPGAEHALAAFEAAMDDDLNTPRALAVLFDLVNEGHRLLEADHATAHASARGIGEVLLRCGGVLGLFRQGLSDIDSTARQHVETLIVERDTARKAKDFARADLIREALRKEGYVLADTAGGTLWQKAS